MKREEEWQKEELKLQEYRELFTLLVQQNYG